MEEDEVTKHCISQAIPEGIHYEDELVQNLKVSVMLGQTPLYCSTTIKDLIVTNKLKVITNYFPC